MKPNLNLLRRVLRDAENCRLEMSSWSFCMIGCHLKQTKHKSIDQLPCLVKRTHHLSHHRSAQAYDYMQTVANYLGITRAEAYDLFRNRGESKAKTLDRLRRFIAKHEPVQRKTRRRTAGLKPSTRPRERKPWLDGLTSAARIARNGFAFMTHL